MDQKGVIGIFVLFIIIAFAIGQCMYKERDETVANNARLINQQAGKTLACVTGEFYSRRGQYIVPCNP
jgi:hypothetical protein